MNLRNAGRLQEPTCEEFLDRHGEYIDGMLTPLESARLALHMDVCDACARYDRVVSRSLSMVTELPEIEPSEDFEQRLQHRIFHLEDAAVLERPRSAAGAAAALAVAASLALLAWSPMLMRDDAPAATARNAVAGFQAVSDPLFHGGEVWYPAPVRAPAPMATLVSFPGPYSPLVVSPPQHRTAPERAPLD